MTDATRVDLLSELGKAYPDGLSEGRRTVVYELFSMDNSLQTFNAFLRRVWPEQRQSEVTTYSLDLAGIDFIGPSAASALAESVVAFIKDRKRPVVLVNVRSEVLEGIQTCRYVQTERSVLCALDLAGDVHFVGALPDRLLKVMRCLENAGPEDMSASALAEISERDQSRSVVNRYSVYLQELHNLGLVVRRKIGALDRTDAERGWTYIYTTAYAAVAEYRKWRIDGSA